MQKSSWGKDHSTQNGQSKGSHEKSHLFGGNTSRASFSVGVLARWSGLSLSGLRYLDDLGVIHSKRNPNNNYREYDSDAFVSLVPFMEYRAMDMNQADSLQLLDANEDNAEHILTAHRDAVLAHAQKVAEDVDRYINRLQLSKRVGQIEYIKSPGFYIHTDPTYTMKTGSLSMEDFYRYVDADTCWRAYMPIATFAIVYSKTDGYQRGTRCHAMTLDDACTLGIESDATTYFVPPEMCLHTFANIRSADADTYSLENICDSLDTTRYTIGDTEAVVQVISMHRDTGTMMTCCEVWLPVRPSIEA